MGKKKSREADNHSAHRNQGGYCREDDRESKQLCFASDPGRFAKKITANSGFYVIICLVDERFEDRWSRFSKNTLRTVGSSFQGVFIYINKKDLSCERPAIFRIVGWAVYPSSQVLLAECVGNHFRPQQSLIYSIHLVSL